MQFTLTTLTLALAALATAAPAPAPVIDERQVGTAILQFEINPDTFTSNTKVTLGTRIDTNLNIISASIASVKGSPKPSSHASCQAFKQSTKVGEPFTLAHKTVFNKGKKVQITAIECDA